MSEKTFEEVLDETMSEFNEIKDVHNPLMGKMKKIFKNYFDTEPKVYAKLVEFDYMVGDVPEQGKANKLKQFLDMFGQVMRFYALMERDDEIVSYLNSNFNLNLAVEPRKPVQAGDTYKAEKFISEVYGDNTTTYMQDPKALVETIVRAGVETRQNIDIHKAEIEAIVGGSSELTLPAVMKILALRYTKEQGKDITSKIDKLDDDVDKAEFISTSAHKLVDSE